MNFLEELLDNAEHLTWQEALVFGGLAALVIAVLLIAVLFMLASRVSRLEKRQEERTSRLESRVEETAKASDEERRRSLEESGKAREELNEQLQRTARELADGQQSQLEMLSGRLRADSIRSEERFEDLERTVSDRMSGYDSRLGGVEKSLESGLAGLRGTVEQGLERLSQENRASVEQLRLSAANAAPVSAGLEDSFAQMNRRLDEINGSLRDVQAIAGNVDELGRTLGRNVTGLWGEVQLETLLSQMLAPGQYAAHARVSPDSDAAADFAVVMPGQGHEHTVLLPIDASLSVREYAELCGALKNGTREEIRDAESMLESSVRMHARRTGEKLIAPPYTTDYGVLFLQNERLFAEVVRIPGLAQKIQSESRMMLCGPTTLAALLTSLQAGFRSLAIDKQTKEIERLLAAVRTDIGSFAGALDQTHRRLRQATESLETAQKQTENIARHLSDVRELPQKEAAKLLSDGEEEGWNGEDAWDD